ncbi:MAG: hypothetical protein ACI9YE_000752 [Psychroserpens sp.]|jgi:hypothetical protein
MNTQRYQIWPQMWLCFIFIFSGCFYGFMPEAWLDNIMQSYHHGLTWRLALAISSPIFLSGAIASVITYWLLYVPGGREPVTHIAGSVRLKGRKAKSHAKRSLNKTIKNDAMGKGIHLHPCVQLPMRNELANVLLFGQQGSGKSVILKPIIQQIKKRGDKLFIYDRKNEFTPLFFDADTTLISPTDIRGTAWEIGLDVTCEAEAELVAQRLINETQDPLWSNGARLILTGCMMILITQNKSWGWRDLAGIIAWPHKELRAALATSYPSATVFIEENSKTTQSFFVTLISQLSWVRRLREYWPNSQQKGFSIRQWLSDESQPKTLIIAHDEHNETLSAPLCNALFGLMTNHVLALADSDTRRILFSVDELSSLPKTDSLEKWLRLGRAKGTRTLASVQSLSQVRALYGQDMAETILSLFGNIIALRMGASGEAASYAAKSFGEHQVERRLTTFNEQGQRSTQCQYISEPLVRPDELINLKHSWRGVEGFLMVGSWDSIYKLRWSFPTLKSIAEPFIRATPLPPPLAKDAMSLSTLGSKPVSKPKGRKVNRLRRHTS